MKSLIQIAPSIVKVLQQAWDKAGNPITRIPAIISFFFGPSPFFALFTCTKVY